MKHWLLVLSIFVNACPGGTAQDDHMTQNPQLPELVRENNFEAVRSALKAGADINTQDDHKRNLLLIATIAQQTEMAKLLLQYGADVNMQDDKLDSPFLYAGASGQTELVKLFLSKGARFDIFNRYGGSALIPACERGHLETVQVLVNTPDYPIDHVNRLGWTALLEAVILGDGTEKYQEVIRLLKNSGADLNIPDNDGITALEHAKRAGYNEIVKILSE